MKEKINRKKIAIGLIASMMILSMSISSYATSEVEQNQILNTAIQIVKSSLEEGDIKIPIKEEQLEQKQEQVQNQIEKWNTLSQAEKEQIYDINSNAREVLKEMVKKYLNINLIEQGEANLALEQIENLDNNKQTKEKTSDQNKANSKTLPTLIKNDKT